MEMHAIGARIQNTAWCHQYSSGSANHKPPMSASCPSSRHRAITFSAMVAGSFPKQCCGSQYLFGGPWENLTGLTPASMSAIFHRLTKAVRFSPSRGNSPRPIAIICHNPTASMGNSLGMIAISSLWVKPVRPRYSVVIWIIIIIVLVLTSQLYRC